MVHLSYCDKFQLLEKLENRAYGCSKSSKFPIRLPPKPMSWTCFNFNCHQYKVHCDYGRTSYHELRNTERYKCPLGFEYECDVDLRFNIL